MRDLKCLFLVNGSENSAAAERAKAFSQRMVAHWKTQTLYRPARKWKGIAPMTQAARRMRPDIVYVMDTAYTGVLAGRLAQLQTGCRMVTDTGDAAYELAKSCGTYSSQQLALIRTIENTAMRRSEGIVVRGSFHRDLLRLEGKTSVEFVPDGVDVGATAAAASESAREGFRREHGLEGSLVLGLVGSMNWSERHGMCYGWDIVEALAHLKERPVRALLIGDGNGRAKLEARATQLGVADRIVWTGYRNYERLPEAIVAMDVCVSTQSNDIVGQVRTTGKLPIYLACGRYMVATEVGEAKRVLPGVGGLLAYDGVRDEGHPARLADHVRMLLSAPERLQVAERARDLAWREFDYSVLTQRLTHFCEGLLPGVRHHQAHGSA